MAQDEKNNSFREYVGAAVLGRQERLHSRQNIDPCELHERNLLDLIIESVGEIGDYDGPPHGDLHPFSSSLSAAPAQPAAVKGAALSASERACYEYPGEDQVALRAAFVAGACFVAENPPSPPAQPAPLDEGHRSPDAPCQCFGDSGLQASTYHDTDDKERCDLCGGLVSDDPLPLDEGAAGELRKAGWSVAVHNDYRLNGEAHTFWLWTHPDGRWIKGEGRNDADALSQCLAAIRAHPSPPAASGDAILDEDRMPVGRPRPPMTRLGWRWGRWSMVWSNFGVVRPLRPAQMWRWFASASVKPSQH